MTIGKVFKGAVKNVAKKTAEKTSKTFAEKAGQKVGEIAVGKGSKQIRKILHERKKKQMSKDAQNKLTNILQNKQPKNQMRLMVTLKRKMVTLSSRWTGTIFMIGIMPFSA